MIVVSDTSSILNLSKVGRLGLLQALYGRVFIPPAVTDELQRNSVRLDKDWVCIQKPQNIAAVIALQSLLDPGESEAIVLAEDCAAHKLLIDERRGWEIATDRRLTCVGLLAVLTEAKRKGLITACRPILDDMIREAGFWIGDRLYERFISGVGEL